MLNSVIEHYIRLPHPLPPLLAMGAWFNNTLCLTVGDEARISRSVGNLDTPEACRAHEKIARQLLAELGVKPHAIAHDLHPDFHSSRFAAQLADELGVPLIAVQHHHAHIAAVCAEHGVEHPVLGLALDGVGLGTDGTAWGGELLQLFPTLQACPELVEAGGNRFVRLGHLHPLPLPGGDRAAQEPWRMAAAVLHELGRNDEIRERFADQAAAETVATMLNRNINCPCTSSMGRVFDAAAGLLSLCRIMEFDAQAAIALEQTATRYATAHDLPQALADGWQIDTSNQLNLFNLLNHLANEKEAEHGAALFHATLIAALADWVLHAAKQTGIITVACGGGCFFNKILSTGLREHLDGLGIKMLTAPTLAPGDTAISLGQAWVATKQLAKE